MSASLPSAATPAASIALPEPARGGRTIRRLAATLLVAGLATATTIVGTTASWTAQTENPGNKITAGTLALTNDRDATSLFETTNIKPGDTGTSNVTLRNAGSLPMTVKLTQDQVVNGFAAGSAQLQVYDATRDYCYYPTAAAGACTAYGDWAGGAKLAALAIPAKDGSAQWPAAESHTFRVNWKLAESSPNSDQGKAASFRLVWNGLQ